MPLINGTKMACEPCIRGHRSTKCNHANERLMVPVRKPGRPLSQCPHPGGQSCMCGSVTAAIPRKQTCHCGGPDSPTPTQVATLPRAPVNSNVADLPSPTKPSFKIQKNTRPQSGGRKQSFEPSNLEKIDMNSVNILPFKQQPRMQSIPPNMVAPNGYAMVSPPQTYGYPPQYAVSQSQYVSVPMQPPPMPYAGSSPIAGVNGFSNGLVHEKEPYVLESPLAAPTVYANSIATNGSSNGHLNGHAGTISNGGSPSSSTTNGHHTNGASKPAKKSCCAPKDENHSRTASVAIPEAAEPKAKSCCSSKVPQPLKQEPVSAQGASVFSHGQIPHQAMALGGIPLQPAYYPHYVPNDQTVFTYPPTYGSFQNPLQPQAWRESMRSHNYAPSPLPMVGPLSYQSLPPDTVHNCSCGDGCQCVGCAAHPYNEPTQHLVRSAWQMSVDQSNEVYNNGHPPSLMNENGHNSVQPQNGDSVAASPTALTPSSTTSGTMEEQTLSPADFLFVSYPFSNPGDGCGGDTMTCPCGDDCECIGCEIHRRPIGNCCGTEDTCNCGDDCQCLGCTIHNPQPSA